MQPVHDVLNLSLDTDLNVYDSDKKYLESLNLNDSVINSFTDIDSIIIIVGNLNRLLNKKYEQWAASDYDEQYGWDVLPNELAKESLIDALDKHRVLYIKIINNRSINIYSGNCEDINKLIISFSVISD